MIAHHDQPEAFRCRDSDFSSEFGQLGIYEYHFAHLRSPYKLKIVLYISYERNRIINAHLHAAIVRRAIVVLKHYSNARKLTHMRGYPQENQTCRFVRYVCQRLDCMGVVVSFIRA